jgi:hypothetical protein
MYICVSIYLIHICVSMYLHSLIYIYIFIYIGCIEISEIYLSGQGIADSLYGLAGDQ